MAIVLLVGLDIDQADACRSALGDRIRVLCSFDAAAAVPLLAFHRPRLVVLRANVPTSAMQVIAEIAERVEARIVSIAPAETPASVERLVEGAARLAFGTGEEQGPTPTRSGTRPLVSPGRYGFASSGGRRRK